MIKNCFVPKLINLFEFDQDRKKESFRLEDYFMKEDDKKTWIREFHLCLFFIFQMLKYENMILYNEVMNVVKYSMKYEMIII